MKLRFITLALTFLLVVSCKKKEASAVTSFYDTQLFKDVQLAAIFKDSKTFVDLVPKAHFLELEANYLEAKKAEGFNLENFVEDNFEDRSMKALEFETDTTKTMYEHIALMWDKLTRGPDSVIPNSSRIALPYKYVVPGGRFQEIYYWDSYFTMEGLLADGREDLAKGMVDNFSFLIDSIGFIPNGTRNYYKSRSQPPYYALMVDALCSNDRKQLVDYLPQLQKEYDFWTNGLESVDSGEVAVHVIKINNNTHLNRFWDTDYTPRPEAYKEDLHLADGQENDSLKKLLFNHLRSAAASGWDFSSRWFGEKGDFRTTETAAILPVDLNCLLYFMENLIAEAAMISGDQGHGKAFQEKAAQRKEAIQKYFWNVDEGFYFDYNFEDNTTASELTLAGVFPLYFNIADENQAKLVSEKIKSTFLKDGGLVTTLEHSGQQWDAPNGWAPLQWIAVKGLLNYGFEEDAVEIIHRWLALNEKVYKNTGKMMEKYNVEDLSLLSGGGEYETQDGFGWTNGVAVGFKKILEDLEKQNQ